MDRAICPCCQRSYTLDAGNLPDHNDRSGDECRGANLPLWAAALEAEEIDGD